MSWPLQDAKNHFSKVVKLAVKEGPQYVTVRGVKTAVVVSLEDFESQKRSKPNFVDALLAMPHPGDDILDAMDQRIEWVPRDIEL